jgi:hypothetical protein
MRLGRPRTRTGRPWVSFAVVLPILAGIVTGVGVGHAGSPGLPAMEYGAGPADSSNLSSGTPCNATPLPGISLPLAVPSPGAPPFSSSPLPAAPRHPATDALFYFEETGLAYGTSWGVALFSNISGFEVAYNNSTGNTINYTVASGTYIYIVPPVQGYLQAFCGVVTVNGTADQIPVPFTPFPQWAPPAFLAGIALWSLFVVAVSVSWVRRT